MLMIFTSFGTAGAATLTFNNNGFASAPAAQCIINPDADLRDFTFTAQNTNFQYKKPTNDAGDTLYVNGQADTLPVTGAYYYGTMDAGEKTFAGQCFSLKFPDALLDNNGETHDLWVTFSDVKIRWREAPKLTRGSKASL